MTPSIKHLVYQLAARAAKGKEAQEGKAHVSVTAFLSRVLRKTRSEKVKVAEDTGGGGQGSAAAFEEIS